MDDEDFIPLDQVPAYIDGLIQKSEVLAAQNERLRGDMDARFKTIDRLSDDLKALREQNRVLARYLEQARDSAKQVHDMAMKNVCQHPDTITMENVAIDHLEFLDRLLRAALTATSQEGQG